VRFGLQPAKWRALGLELANRPWLTGIQRAVPNGRQCNTSSNEHAWIAGKNGERTLMPIAAAPASPEALTSDVAPLTLILQGKAPLIMALAQRRDDFPRLTPTEARVLDGLIRGGTVLMAAEGLRQNIQTTRVHVRNLHRKTGTHSIGELIVWGIANARVWKRG
jgi:DNA-binding CsgD family transcriptional regulator